MTELTWFERQVVEHRRLLITGFLEALGKRNDSINAHLNGVQLVELPDGGYVFVVLSYDRRETDPSPELKAVTTRVATVEEALESWHKQFYSGHWTDAEHDTVRIRFGLGGPLVKLSDPWLLYHLGVFTQLARCSEELLLEGSDVRNSLVNTLEALTTARIKRLTDVVGRR